MMRTALLALLFATSPAFATPGVIGEGGDPGLGTDDLDLLELDLVTPELAVWRDGPLPALDIVNGERTTEFPETVAIYADFGRGGAVFCSGTWISPQGVVTAAHCLDAADQYSRQGADILVLFGGNLWQNDIFHYSAASSWLQHPRWTGNLANGADIGVMTINGGPDGYKPMALSMDSASFLRRGEQLDYVGFGVTVDDGDDSGIKRTAQIPYDQLYSDFIIAYSPTYNLCSGDSGGSGLKWSGTRFELVGVNSYVFSPDQDSTPCVGGGSGATRIDLFIDFIDQNTDWSRETNGGGTDPEDTGEPEDTGTIEEPAVDYGDWEDPERPPEDVAGACNSATGVGGFGLLAGLGLVGLFARRRRS